MYWQIWNTPPEASTRNNQIESVNKQIKDCFTKYESFSVINLLNVIGRDIIIYYSYHKHAISLVPNILSENSQDNKLIQLEKQLVDINFQIYTYLHNTVQDTDTSMPTGVIYYFIDMSRRSCTCSYYIDMAICHHLLFASKLYKFTIERQSIPSMSFVKLKASGRKPKNGK